MVFASLAGLAAGCCCTQEDKEAISVDLLQPRESSDYRHPSLASAEDPFEAAVAACAGVPYRPSPSRDPDAPGQPTAHVDQDSDAKANALAGSMSAVSDSQTAAWAAARHALQARASSAYGTGVASQFNVNSRPIAPSGCGADPRIVLTAAGSHTMPSYTAPYGADRSRSVPQQDRGLACSTSFTRTPRASPVQQTRASPMQQTPYRECPTSLATPSSVVRHTHVSPRVVVPTQPVQRRLSSVGARPSSRQPSAVRGTSAEFSTQTRAAIATIDFTQALKDPLLGSGPLTSARSALSPPASARYAPSVGYPGSGTPSNHKPLSTPPAKLGEPASTVDIHSAAETARVADATIRRATSLLESARKGDASGKDPDVRKQIDDTKRALLNTMDALMQAEADLDVPVQSPPVIRHTCPSHVAVMR